MQTRLAENVAGNPEYEELQSIIRSCVHCGFCTATCPTYPLLGDELDGPRGRIYLIKQMAEGHPVGRVTQLHLDRCLTCRSCETACPSGVRYGRLLDIGRNLVDEKVRRPVTERLLRHAISAIFPYRQRFGSLLSVARRIKPLLPPGLKAKTPSRTADGAWPEARHKRTMLIFPGCVQNALTPSIDAAAARVLDTLGISLLPMERGGCCGALSYHLSDRPRALALARSNIDACWPYVEQGAEAIVSTASGCGAVLKDYGAWLKHDAAYGEKAQRVASMTLDIAEILSRESLPAVPPQNLKVAFQAPCTLRHGQKVSGTVERLLQQAGYPLAAVAETPMCCGSAGTYSLLQPVLAERLRDDKLAALTAELPDLIATANIGCLVHLQSAASVPVKHWIELLDKVT
ncbi:MAG: glycolate oxidase subunit GlcF [Gammaproteobacteria bacterium]